MRTFASEQDSSLMRLRIATLVARRESKQWRLFGLALFGLTGLTTEA